MSVGLDRLEHPAGIRGEVPCQRSRRRSSESPKVARAIGSSSSWRSASPSSEGETRRPRRRRRRRGSSGSRRGHWTGRRSPREVRCPPTSGERLSRSIAGASAPSGPGSGRRSEARRRVPRLTTTRRCLRPRPPPATGSRSAPRWSVAARGRGPPPWPAGSAGWRSRVTAPGSMRPARMAGSGDPTTVGSPGAPRWTPSISTRPPWPPIPLPAGPSPSTRTTRTASTWEPARATRCSSPPAGW